MKHAMWQLADYFTALAIIGAATELCVKILDLPGPDLWGWGVFTGLIAATVSGLLSIAAGFAPARW